MVTSVTRGGVQQKPRNFGNRLACREGVTGHTIPFHNHLGPAASAATVTNWYWRIMEHIRLYGLERSVYTRIVRLALEEKGVAYELEAIEVFERDGVPTDHFRRHPFGRIPVLRHGLFVLYEAAAITRYVDEAFAGPSLQPVLAAARARMQQIIGLLDAYAYRPMVRGVFVGGVLAQGQGAKGMDAGAFSKALAASAICLHALEKLIGPGCDWLADRRLSLADIHAFPMLRSLSLAPEGMELLCRHKALFRWFETMLSRPSVLKTRTEHEPDPRPATGSGSVPDAGHVRRVPAPAKVLS